MTKFIVIDEKPTHDKCTYCRNNPSTITIQMLRLASSKKTTHMYLDNKIDLCNTCFDWRY